MKINFYLSRIILIQVCLLSFKIFAQSGSAETDGRWVKWGKADYSYQMPDKFEHRDYSLKEKNTGRFLLKTFADTYWLLISDVDGDNCSFSPTCSNFFLQSVEATNLFQGSLMFFDRFTRDMDIFGKMGHYPYALDGYLYDPPSNYKLDKDSIKYIPPSVVVKNE